MHRITYRHIPYHVGDSSQSPESADARAKSTMATKKPMPEPKELTKACRYPKVGSSAPFSSTSMVTPSTAQLVVISGR